MSSDAKKKLGRGPSFADITAINGTSTEAKEKSSKSPNPSMSTKKEFKTDRDISKARSRSDRTLEKWSPDGTLVPEVDLNREGSQKGGKTSWDQFAENERLFGVRTDFDESHYTTPVGRDKVHPEEFKKRELEAEKLAKEILTKSGTPMTVHVAEERGLLLPDDMDEEERYGSVIRRVSVVSTEDHVQPSRKSSIASLGEKAVSPSSQQQSASNPRRKSIVEQVSEDMNSAMKGILEGRQRRKSSLNPDAPEFSLNVDAPEYTPQESIGFQQHHNMPYSQYPMIDYSDPQVMNAMMQAYYAYDPYTANAYYAAAFQEAGNAPSTIQQPEGMYNPHAYYRPYRQQYVRNGDGHHSTSSSHDNLKHPGSATKSPQ